MRRPNQGHTSRRARITSADPYGCPECGSSFLSPKSRALHRRAAHGINPVSLCVRHPRLGRRSFVDTRRQVAANRFGMFGTQRSIACGLSS